MSFADLKRFSRTVGFRIALWHSTAFIVGAALVFGVAYFFLRHSIDEQTGDAIDFRLTQFEAEYGRGGKEAVVGLCKLRLGRAQKAFFVRLADPQNNTLFLRDPEDWAEFHPQVLASQRIDEMLPWTELSGLEGSILRIATKKMGDNSILQVGKTLEARTELLERFRSAMFIIAALVILAGVLGGASSAFRALRPVHALTATVGSILDTRKFDARVPSRGTGDEIDELVQCFNVMLGKIDLLIRGMRDSLDNVAHDLRTPMTRLRIIANKAVEQDYDKEACHDVLSDCLEESERVMTMLVTLMDIAEVETGVMKLERHSVNVAQLVRHIIDLYEHVAEEKEITIVVKVPNNLHLSGDVSRLQRALGNLMDNSLKFTPAGGRVTITAVRVDRGITLEVRDTGEGLQKDELERVWERLYRVEKSRSQRGLGLGLSFVKAIVEAHRGTVSVESEAGKGAAFKVYLPD